MKTTSTLIPLIFAASTYAHGLLHQITINGKSFLGNGVDGGTPIPSVIRQISSPNPNKGASNPAVNCGPDAQPATLIANANPGDQLGFDWKGADGSNWPHNTGPMLTYLASCGSTTCDKFDAQTAKWFKIDQVGRAPGSADWVQQSLMSGSLANVKLPSNLAPGNYLVRHEIIALHLATSQGGAEFYPACSQLTVGGSGTGVPDASELVSLPGAYSDNDPGIFDPKVFDASAPYTFPGPPVAAFVNGGTSTPGNATTTASSTATATNIGGAKPTVTSTPSKGKTCKLKKAKSASSSVVPSASSAAPSATTTDMYPRHFSRVMRRLALGRSI